MTAIAQPEEVIVAGVAGTGAVENWKRPEPTDFVIEKQGKWDQDTTVPARQTLSWKGLGEPRRVEVGD